MRVCSYLPPSRGRQERQLPSRDAACEFEPSEELCQPLEILEVEAPVEAVEVVAALTNGHAGRARRLCRELTQVLHPPVARRDEGRVDAECLGDRSGPLRDPDREDEWQPGP